MTDELLITDNTIEPVISWRSVEQIEGGEYTLADSPEFQQFGAMFREYTVQYMTVKIIPNRNIISESRDDAPVNQAMHIGSVESASAPVAVLGGNGLLKCPDYKITPGLAVHTRSYKVRRYYKNRNIDWASTQITI